MIMIDGKHAASLKEKTNETKIQIFSR